MQRLNISVVALIDEDGNITPMYVYKCGKYYKVDKVLSVRRHAPDVECISPLRYDCIIEGKKKTVYEDSHPSRKWFSVVENLPNTDI